MPGPLPTLTDLAPPDRPGVPVRPDGVLDLLHPAALDALLRLLARRAGLDADAALRWHKLPPYGWRLVAGRTSALWSGLYGVHAVATAPHIQHEPATPSGARRAAVRAWRATLTPAHAGSPYRPAPHADR
jgi:hypothetical protein